MKPTRRCKICRDRYLPQFQEPICKKSECRVAYFELNKEKVIEKARKEREKKAREEKKQGREKLKTKSDYEKELQTEINHIVRLIDKGCPCIATGAVIGKMNAGHFLSAGSHPSVRFNLLNIWIQSEHSNSHKSGDSLRYRDGLESIYGKEFTDNLYSYLKQTEPIKLSIEDLREKKKIARDIVARLKKLDLTYSTEMRLEYRKNLNGMIGIYKPVNF